MSYILDALTKSDKTQPIANQSSVNSPSGLQSPVIHTQSETKSIAWGILLTFAIFAALLAGYWIGQQQLLVAKIDANETNTNQPIKNNSQANELNQQLTNNAGNSVDNQIQALTPILSPVRKSAQKIAAEQYFTNPPTLQNQKKDNKASETSDNVAKQINGLADVPNQEPLTDTPVEFNVSAEDGISDELLSRFQSAIEETDENKVNDLAEEKQIEEVLPLNQQPNWVQKGVPTLDFEMHIYASDGQGWIRVNGEDRYEGDIISNDLVLDKILPQKVILNFRGEQFSLPALSNWQ